MLCNSATAPVPLSPMAQVFPSDLVTSGGPPESRVASDFATPLPEGRRFNSRKTGVSFSSNSRPENVIEQPKNCQTSSTPSSSAPSTTLHKISKISFITGICNKARSHFTILPSGAGELGFLDRRKIATCHENAFTCLPIETSVALRLLQLCT